MNKSVLNFIIDQSRTRREKYGEAFSMDCLESVEIYDELDSLTKEELESVITVYKLGLSGDKQSDFSQLTEGEKDSKVIEIIAFDRNLSEVLSSGFSVLDKNTA